MGRPYEKKSFKPDFSYFHHLSISMREFPLEIELCEIIHIGMIKKILIREELHPKEITNNIGQIRVKARVNSLNHGKIGSIIQSIFWIMRSRFVS